MLKRLLSEFLSIARLAQKLVSSDTKRSQDNVALLFEHFLQILGERESCKALS
jgi:hypothetical protein